MTTETTTQPQKRRLPKFIRIMILRPRLFASLGVGTLVFLALFLTDNRMPTRLLIGWDVCVALYLVLAFRMAARSQQEHIRRRAKTQDEGQFAILALTAIAAFASLAAIFVLLGSSGGATRDPLSLVFATLTIVLSWAFTHTMFGLHYAHEYYDERGGRGGGMEFPGDGTDPDYWDFFYFSFVIGMCAQVSDITVSCQPIRRTVFAHSIISFVFNAALLALTVNIAASAISTPPG
jgi:uncharacterized membrane protein